MVSVNLNFYIFLILGKLWRPVPGYPVYLECNLTARSSLLMGRDPDRMGHTLIYPTHLEAPVPLGARNILGSTWLERL